VIKSLKTDSEADVPNSIDVGTFVKLLLIILRGVAFDSGISGRQK